jgi:hypothetical protein
MHFASSSSCGTDEPQQLHLSVHRLDASSLAPSPAVSTTACASMRETQATYRALRRGFLSAWPGLCAPITGDSSPVGGIEGGVSVMVLTGSPEALVALCSHHLHDAPQQQRRGHRGGVWASAISDSNFANRLRSQLSAMRSQVISDITYALPSRH